MEVHRACSSNNSSSSADGHAHVQLPPALQLHILSLLPFNERALGGRLVSPYAAQGLSQAYSCTACLSQPLPAYAATWAVEAGQQHVRQLPFRHKLQLMRSAAASGSEVNLEVALAVLQASVFPELLHHGAQEWRSMSIDRDPGVAAVEAGHPQLLPWLLRHCPGLLCPDRVLQAAAQHCDLAGLQAVWRALQLGVPTHERPTLGQEVLHAAAGSATPDAEAKVQWVLASGESVGLKESTVAAAARLGDLGRLRWLRERGCPMGRFRLWDDVLGNALQHADLAVAQWLVDEAGYELLAGARGWAALLLAAAKGADGAAKLQWLRERGAPHLGSSEELLGQVTREAIAAGRVQTVEYLWTAFGAGRLLPADEAAELAGSSGSIPMLQWLRQAGVELSHTAYAGAGEAGSLPVVRWLAQEAGVSAAGMRFWSMQDLIQQWPSGSATGSRERVQAVQLITGAGYSDWGMLRQAVVWNDLAKRGDLALVQYLQQLQLSQLQQTQWSAAGLLSFAAAAGCEALLEWLAGQPGGLEGGGPASPYRHPAKNGDLATLTTLRRLGVPWGAQNVVVKAVRDGCSVPALRCLVEEGAPVGSREGMKAAARRERSALVRNWMIEQGWPVDGLHSGDALKGQAGQGAN